MNLCRRHQHPSYFIYLLGNKLQLLTVAAGESLENKVNDHEP